MEKEPSFKRSLIIGFAVVLAIIVLAYGFQVTGLSVLIGNAFAGLAGVPPFVLILMVCLSITFLTELTSNTATNTFRCSSWPQTRRG